MNHYLLHVSLEGKPEIPPWQERLAERKLIVLRAASLREAVQYCRVYPLLMVLLECDGGGAAIQEAAATLAATAPDGRQPSPVLGLCATPLSEGQRDALAAAGLVGLLAKDDPEQFICWRLELLATLSDLRHFEQSRMDVSTLATDTRTHLHDLSQPLSAVQGRLQLLAAKHPSDDPEGTRAAKLRPDDVLDREHLSGRHLNRYREGAAVVARRRESAVDRRLREVGQRHVRCRGPRIHDPERADERLAAGSRRLGGRQNPLLCGRAVAEGRQGENESE